MSAWFKRRSSPEVDASERLHDALVAVIRQPSFYTDDGVPDTFEGRFDLLVLHAALVLRRLRDLGPEGRDLAQRLTDVLFSRFDIALRELGVSDVAVPKRMKRLAEAFKGRTAAYDGALLARDHDRLLLAIGRNVLNGERAATNLAAYAASTDEHLQSVDLATLQSGRLPFASRPSR